jgi:hypothetical protein
LALQIDKFFLRPRLGARRARAKAVAVQPSKLAPQRPPGAHGKQRIQQQQPEVGCVNFLVDNPAYRHHLPARQLLRARRQRKLYAPAFALYYFYPIHDNG